MGERPTWLTDVIAASGELLATTIFLLLGLGGIQAAALAQMNSNPPPSGLTVEQLLYIATSMGLSLLFTCFIWFRVTGSVCNPNVALALVLTGVLTPLRFVLYVFAEIIGAIIASALLSGLLPGPLMVTSTLSPGVGLAQGIFIEAFGTAALCLTVMFVAVEKHAATPLAPVAIGLTLFAIHLWAVIYTGAAVNFARNFGPAVVTGFKSDFWIYFVGDGIGSLIAVAFYSFFKYVDYWELTPGQDSQNMEDSPELPGAPSVATTRTNTRTKSNAGSSRSDGDMEMRNYESHNSEYSSRNPLEKRGGGRQARPVGNGMHDMV
ncbi:uncharacterized protein L969DRAFT_74266 [Mixia osmundae IAM 14324]|uniref:Aquaporin n=1 Tax=Mixia osmundae (strain CBS 9802 / IAM 14324 / JCM 22182 / KY 12970) TaxID=764103 RepID=G7DZS3_MIXOS|nr:uncharacterized protein L969DRAFT_74266 [Mixia osmundae IAM 14324]KEI39258.1 hypothetical protein L969DRAFT_74266 [Mixia osmundae IAM 14324]GAA96083.1 hypothetical protein E5Q_02744 [Mixia osmundae IAM 14324]